MIASLRLKAVLVAIVYGRWFRWTLAVAGLLGLQLGIYTCTNLGVQGFSQSGIVEAVLFEGNTCHAEVRLAVGGTTRTRLPVQKESCTDGRTVLLSRRPDSTEYEFLRFLD